MELETEDRDEISDNEPMVEGNEDDATVPPLN